MKIFVLYRLRPGIALEEYLRWSRERDQPALDGSPNVTSFEVHTVESMQGAGAFEVVETIEVANWTEWESATQSEAIRALGADFERLVDPSSVVLLRGERVSKNP